MSTKLLNCLICPKRPDFSDTSHLLTHVSSKGHLSHLHKLQVRSHQEIAAGHQLGLYNQWYQEHAIGQLLSERMQQKNGKVVLKREANITKDHKASNVAVHSSSNMFEDPFVVGCEIKPGKRVLKEELSNDDSEYPSSPVKRGRKRKPSQNARSVPNKHSLWAPELADEDPYVAATVRLDLVLTPEASRLKGVIWPGMHLFDAASHEAKRKRNQSKDASVLENMEKISELVEPYEIVYSSGGTKIKERFIDGKIDSSSPLRGETCNVKAQLPKKRQPLAPVSGNISRNTRAKATTKLTKARTMAKVRSRTKSLKVFRTPVPSSSTGDLLESMPDFSSVAKEHLHNPLMIGGPEKRKSRSNFTIYKTDDIQRSRMPRLDPRNPFNAVPNQIYPARTQLSFISAPWLQPQNQYPSHLQYGNPYMAYTGDGRAYPNVHQQQPLLFKHESPSGIGFKQTYSPTRTDWTHQDMPHENSFPASMHPSYSFFGGLSCQDDPFGHSRNPLNTAFHQVASDFHHGMTSSDARTPSPVKKNPVGMSLDDTTSESEDAKGLGQVLFATSE